MKHVRSSLVCAIVGVSLVVASGLEAKPGKGGGGGAGPLKIVRKLKGHENAVAAVAFAGNGTTLASISLDLTLRMWDAMKEKGNPLRSIKFDDGTLLSQVVFHPGSREQIAVATSEGVLVYSFEGKQQHKLAINQKGAVGVAFGPSGDVIAGIGPEGVQTWMSDTGVKIKFTPKIKDGITVAYRPTAPGLIAIGRENKVTLWTPSEDSLNNLEAGGDIVSLAFSNDGKTLAAFSSDRSVRCFSAPDWNLSWEQRDIANDARIGFDTKDSVVLLGGPESVKALDIKDGTSRWEWKGSGSNVAISPNGKLMATTVDAEILVLTAK